MKTTNVHDIVNGFAHLSGIKDKALTCVMKSGEGYQVGRIGIGVSIVVSCS